MIHIDDSSECAGLKLTTDTTTEERFVVHLLTDTELLNMYSFLVSAGSIIINNAEADIFKKFSENYY
jgi:hypothetical protein